MHESVIVDLWDELRATKGTSAPLAEITFDQMQIADFMSAETKDWGIELLQMDGDKRVLSHDQWRGLLATLKKNYQLVESEWHHAKFAPAGDGTATSTIDVTLHVRNESNQESLIVQAGLNDGDRVCLSALSAVVDGMPVRLQEGDS